MIVSLQHCRSININTNRLVASNYQRFIGGQGGGVAQCGANRVHDIRPQRAEHSHAHITGTRHARHNEQCTSLNALERAIQSRHGPERSPALE